MNKAVPLLVCRTTAVSLSRCAAQTTLFSAQNQNPQEHSPIKHLCCDAALSLTEEVKCHQEQWYLMIAKAPFFSTSQVVSQCQTRLVTLNRVSPRIIPWLWSRQIVGRDSRNLGSRFLRITDQFTSIWVLKRVIVSPAVHRACLNLITLTCRALGRNQFVNTT